MTDDAKPAGKRAIFSYHDADGREKKGDPVELLRRLTTCCGGDPNLLFKKAESPRFDGGGEIVVPEGFDEATSLEANERLAQAVCKAFRLGPVWDETAGAGVPESVWQQALDDFLEYVQGEAGGADGTPTCAPPSAPESSACPTAGNFGSG